MNIIKIIIGGIKQIFFGKEDNPWGNKTLYDLSPQTLEPKNNRSYDESSLLMFIKENPDTCVGYYMLAEILAEKNKLVFAKKSFAMGLRNEKIYHEDALTQKEKKIKQKAKIKIENISKLAD